MSSVPTLASPILPLPTDAEPPPPKAFPVARLRCLRNTRIPRGLHSQAHGGRGRGLVDSLSLYTEAGTQYISDHHHGHGECVTRNKCHSRGPRIVRVENSTQSPHGDRMGSCAVLKATRKAGTSLPGCLPPPSGHEHSHTPTNTRSLHRTHIRLAGILRVPSRETL